MQKEGTTKLYIGIFGKRNAGKSSLINALTGQTTSIVSEHAGTTTDPVKKSMEMAGIGPVVLIDTAGIDDHGPLGDARVAKTMEAIQQVDVALLVITNNCLDNDERQLIEAFLRHKLNFIFVYNKSDIKTPHSTLGDVFNIAYHSDFIAFSAKYPTNVNDLTQLIKKNTKAGQHNKKSLFEGLLRPNDVVLLVTPIDSEAPEGRLILPQVQAIRDVLDNHCVAMVLKETEASLFLQSSNIKPALTVTDSQLFGAIDKIIDKDVPLTSFSILLARQKGDFEYYLQSTPQIGKLKDGDRVLIMESCTHQSNCDDIGRAKIPRWLGEYTGKKLIFEMVSGLSPIPSLAADYALAIQCGGCMVTQKQLHNRLIPFIDAGVAVTNYGMAIAFTKGIFERATAPFKP